MIQSLVMRVQPLLSPCPQKDGDGHVRGKPTLPRVLNRAYDLYPDERVTAVARVDGRDILGTDVGPNLPRSRIRMVFRAPTPFLPMAPSGVSRRRSSRSGTHRSFSRADGIRSARRRQGARLRPNGQPR
jgi:hypothetical protein